MTEPAAVGQRLLAVVTPDGQARLLAALGPAASREGVWMFVVFLRERSLPTAAGFHVWEGTIEGSVPTIGRGGTDEPRPQVSWEGAWRPVVFTDFATFGLPVPLPEGGRD